MSSLDLHLAAGIRAARAALHRAGIDTHPLWLAVNNAAACLADLERAQRLLEQERSSAEAAERALDRAFNLFEIEQQQQRRAEENQQDIDERARLAAAGINSEAEIERLRKTIALAAVAIREAAKIRSTPQPGEEDWVTRQRWDDAHAIETAAIACRKAARKAVASLDSFAHQRTPEQQAEVIEAAQTAALRLKAAIDAQQERAQRERVIAAAARKKGGAL